MYPNETKTLAQWRGAEEWTDVATSVLDAFTLCGAHPGDKVQCVQSETLALPRDWQAWVESTDGPLVGYADRSVLYYAGQPVAFVEHWTPENTATLFVRRLDEIWRYHRHQTAWIPMYHGPWQQSSLYVAKHLGFQTDGIA